MPCHGGLLDIQWTATPAIEGSTSNHKHFDDTLYLHWGWIWFEKKPACREHPPGESLVLSNGSGTQGLLRQDAASNNCLKNTCGAAASYAPCVLQWLWYVPDPVSFLGLERKRATSGNSLLQPLVTQICCESRYMSKRACKDYSKTFQVCRIRAHLENCLQLSSGSASKSVGSLVRYCQNLISILKFAAQPGEGVQVCTG